MWDMGGELGSYLEKGRSETLVFFSRAVKNVNQYLHFPLGDGGCKAASNVIKAF